MKQVVVVVDKMVVVVVVVDKMVRYEQHWIMYVYPDLNILAGQVGPGPMIAAAAMLCTRWSTHSTHCQGKVQTFPRTKPHKGCFIVLHVDFVFTVSTF